MAAGIILPVLMIAAWRLGDAMPGSDYVVPIIAAALGSAVMILAGHMGDRPKKTASKAAKRPPRSRIGRWAHLIVVRQWRGTRARRTAASVLSVITWAYLLLMVFALHHMLGAVPVPIKGLIAVAAAIPVIVLIVAWPEQWKERVEAGLCAGCGYDMRGSTDQCPECGGWRVIMRIEEPDPPRDDQFAHAYRIGRRADAVGRNCVAADQFRRAASDRAARAE